VAAKHPQKFALLLQLFSIETLGFYALMQLFRELHENCSHQKHFFSAQNAPNVVLAPPGPVKGA